MRSRRHRFAAVLLSLAAMLFLQAALAFAPCELPGRAAATAMAAAMASMPDCQGAGEPSLGLAHCAAEDQALMASPQPELPDLAVPATQAAAAVPMTPAPAWQIPPYHATAGPPPRILFQSFLL